MTGRPPGGVQPSAPIREVEWPLVWNNQPLNVPVFWRMREDFYRNQVRLAGENHSNTRVLIYMLTRYRPEDLFLPCQTANICMPGQFTDDTRLLAWWKDERKEQSCCVPSSFIPSSLYSFGLESDRYTSARRSYKSSWWSIFWPGLKCNKMNITYR